MKFIDHVIQSGRAVIYPVYKGTYERRAPMAAPDREMTLEAVEFIRRFLLHVFPSGFVHIRHFGFISNRRRKVELALCRSLLPARQAAVESSADSPTNRDSPAEEPMARRCPVCKVGRLMFVQALSGEMLDSLSTPTVADTS